MSNNTSVFFGENGLTTTSANHVANLAKERYLSLVSKLENFQFHTKTASLLSSSVERTISIGLSDISFFEPTLKEISELKSLIAWLREAIKKKDALIKEAQRISEEEICKILGLEYAVMPERKAPITKEEYIESLPIKERNRYYTLETECAVIGSFIHPDGEFAKARKKYYEILQNPTIIRGEGRDAMIFDLKPTISAEDIEDGFFKLQQLYRSKQAELNKMKHEIELACQNDAFKKDAEYTLSVREWQTKRKENGAKCDEYRDKKIAEMQALKIAIPDSLKSIWTKLGK